MFELKLFDIVEHKKGKKQMVVSIQEEKEFSCLDGCGNRFMWDEKHPLHSDWCNNPIIKVWRPRSRATFGFFLNGGFAEKDFDLVWERAKAHTITIDDKEIKISEESYQELKKSLLGE